MMQFAIKLFIKQVLLVGNWTADVKHEPKVISPIISTKKVKPVPHISTPQGQLLLAWYGELKILQILMAHVKNLKNFVLILKAFFHAFYR